MSDSTWDKIKSIPKVLEAAAGKSSPKPSPPSSTSPSWPANTISHQPPLGQKDTNLPLKGSVYDPDRSPTSGAKKISSRRSVTRPLSRRA